MASEPVESIEHLYRRRYESFVRLARVIVGSQSIAEELTQEAFARILAAPRSLEHPDAYARTVLVNLCRDWLTRTGRDRREASTGPDRTDHDVAMPSDVDETWTAVCRLPPRYRTVLAMRFYADLTEPEIARQLGIRVGTVKSTIHRGLAKLRKEVER